MARYTVGEMAELCCISRRALRHYHDMGILIPDQVDEATGYRYYSIDQSSTVDMIQHLQAIGFSLEEIKLLNEKRDIEELAHMLAGKMDEVVEQMKELSYKKLMTQDMLDRCKICLSESIENQIMLEQLPERRIIIFENPDPDQLAVPDGKTCLRNWEYNLRHIKRLFIDNDIPLAFFRNTGCIITEENLRAGKLVTTHSFTLIGDALQDSPVPTSVIPAGQYLTMLSTKTLAPDESFGETYELKRILEYAERKGFEICGDYFGESLADTPAFLFEGRNCLLKLCLPVRRKSR